MEWATCALTICCTLRSPCGIMKSRHSRRKVPDLADRRFASGAPRTRERLVRRHPGANNLFNGVGSAVTMKRKDRNLQRPMPFRLTIGGQVTKYRQALRALNTDLRSGEYDQGRAVRHAPEASTSALTWFADVLEHGIVFSALTCFFCFAVTSSVHAQATEGQVKARQHKSQPNLRNLAPGADTADRQKINATDRAHDQDQAFDHGG